MLDDKDMCDCNCYCSTHDENGVCTSCHDQWTVVFNGWQGARDTYDFTDFGAAVNKLSECEKFIMKYPEYDGRVHLYQSRKECHQFRNNPAKKESMELLLSMFG